MMTVSFVLRGLLKAASPVVFVSSPPPAIGCKTPLLRGLLSVCALFSMVLVSSPVFAGHYDRVYVFSGSISPGVPDSSGNLVTNWATLGNTGASDSFNGPVGKAASVSSSGTITATFTWVRDPNVANDDPPTTVLVMESGGASWNAHIDGAQWQSMTGQPCPKDYAITGTADGGFGTPYVADPPGQNGVLSGQSGTRAKFVKTSGGQTFSVSVYGEASASGSGGRYWRGGVSCGVGFAAVIVDGSAHASASFSLTPDDEYSPGWENREFVYIGPRPNNDTIFRTYGPAGPPGIAVSLEHTDLAVDITETVAQYYQYTGSGPRPHLFLSGIARADGDVSHKVFTASSSYTIKIAENIQVDETGSAPQGDQLYYGLLTLIPPGDVGFGAPPYNILVTLKAKASTK